MSEPTARAVLSDALAHGGTLNAIELGHSRDGKRRVWRLLIATNSTVTDTTIAVATLIHWERGRRGGIIVDRHGYDGLARLTDALIAAGQYVGMGTVH